MGSSIHRQLLLWKMFAILLLGLLIYGSLYPKAIYAQQFDQVTVTTPFDITHIPNDLSILNSIPTISYLGNSASRRTPANVRTRLSKRTYRANEKLTVTFTNPGNDQLTLSVIGRDNNEMSILTESTTVNGVTTLSVLPTKELKPGKYTLRVKNFAGKMLEQDFVWGVLAVNTNKSIYNTREKAHIEMAVLNDLGNMVCDAKVTLKIQNIRKAIDDTLSTENGKIKINPECYSHDFTLVPDYETSYVVGEEGMYTMTLTAQTSNGKYVITDSFEVRNDKPFDVERVTATRIYPPNDYPVIFKIKANQDFDGIIRESVPQSFGTTEMSVYTGITDDSIKENVLASPAATITPTVPKIPSQITLPVGASSSADSNVATLSGTEIITPSVQPHQFTSGFKTQNISLQLPFLGSYPITQNFGEETTDPLLLMKYKSFGLLGHDGVDFGVPQGTPVLAAESGIVIFAGPGDYGNTIVVQHDWGRTYYGHLSVVDVHIGQQVNKGVHIGLSGNTGLSTGPHLHFGVKFIDFDDHNGYYGKVDPLMYINNVITRAVAGASDRMQPIKSLSKVSVIQYPLKLKKGETVQLVYRYQAPKVSPEMYLLGPLEFVDNQNHQIFAESRQWQIAADAVWVSSAWKYRKSITIDHTKVSDTGTSNYSYFPVLINLSSDSNLQTNAKTNGYDIMFTSSDGSTKIPAEIESYTSGSGALIAWVNIPTLYYNQSTIIYMYYGNGDSCDQTSSGCSTIDSTKNKNTTWTLANYIGVWHMQENPSTTDPTDSTGHGFTLTRTGTLGSVTGKVGNAISFDGSTAYLSRADDATFDPSTNITISAWTRFTQTPSTAGHDMIWAKHHSTWDGTTDHSWRVYNENGGGTDRLNFEWYNGTTNYYANNWPTGVSAGTYIFQTFVKSGTAPFIYFNGTDETSTTFTSSGSLKNGDGALIIGADLGATHEFYGYIDEFRLASDGKTTGWINTEYQNQNSPSTFYTLGAQECMNPPTMDMVMRHGKYFNACGRQGFTW